MNYDKNLAFFYMSFSSSKVAFSSALAFSTFASALSRSSEMGNRGLICERGGGGGGGGGMGEKQ